MSPYRKAWLAWGLTTLTSFGVIEAKALLSGQANATLSSNLRHVFGFTHHEHHAPLRRLAFYAGVGWLTWHIAEPVGREMRRAHRQM